jgi:hypothetical protein
MNRCKRWPIGGHCALSANHPLPSMGRLRLGDSCEAREQEAGNHRNAADNDQANAEI